MIKLPYKTEEAIEQEVNDFLYRCGINSVPVDVELLAEKLGFRIVPIATADRSFKGFLSTKTHEIGIKLSFFDEGCDNIYRFTIAHELAHFVMHMSIYKNFCGSTLDEWTDFYINNSDTIDRAERQADIFAGFLLLPSKFLNEDLKALNKAFAAYKDEDVRTDRIEYIIARKYVVAHKTAQIRLQNIAKAKKGE